MLHLKIKNKKTVYPPTGYLMNLRCAESPAFYVLRRFPEYVTWDWPLEEELKHARGLGRESSVCKGQGAPEPLGSSGRRLGPF